MVSFDNTEIAFAGKSNKELKKAHFLFSMLSRKWMVRTGKFFTNLAFSLRLPVSGIIKKTLFEQFVGGESIEESEKTIAYLSKYHIGTILDYSVEGQQEESVFDNTLSELLKTIELAKSDKRIPFCVFKVSGIARHFILEKVSSGADLSVDEYAEWERVKNRVNKLCKRAFESETPILIDAEESWIQQSIDDLALEMMVLYNKDRAIVYNTVQLYRHDRLSYIKNLYSKSCDKNFFIGLKLVRGAYMEKERERALKLNYPDPIQADKSSTDRAFDEALRFCIQHIHKISICAGTHNEQSSLLLTEIMHENEIQNNYSGIWFAQLLGMSDHISFNLSLEKYNVAKYVPYGPVKEVLPYLIRRAEENTSVKGQTGRELSLIRMELKRRKL